MRWGVGPRRLSVGESRGMAVRKSGSPPGGLTSPRHLATANNCSRVGTATPQRDAPFVQRLIVPLKNPYGTWLVSHGPSLPRIVRLGTAPAHRMR